MDAEIANVWHNQTVKMRNKFNLIVYLILVVLGASALVGSIIGVSVVLLYNFITNL